MPYKCPYLRILYYPWFVTLFRENISRGADGTRGGSVAACVGPGSYKEMSSISLLTNSTLLYESQLRMDGGGWVAGSHSIGTAKHIVTWSPTLGIYLQI
jgi:hypothetical protein